MAKRNFGARNNEVNLLLLSLARMSTSEATRLANAWAAVPGEQRDGMRAEARRQLRTAPPIVRRTWSAARVYATDTIRKIAYERGGVHYGDMGDENKMPWGTARAAARDIAGAWAVMPYLEPALANELMRPGRVLFRFLHAR